jgi:hypothetical protein
VGFSGYFKTELTLDSEIQTSLEILQKYPVTFLTSIRSSTRFCFQFLKYLNTFKIEEEIGIFMVSTLILNAKFS